MKWVKNTLQVTIGLSLLRWHNFKYNRHTFEVSCRLHVPKLEDFTSISKAAISPPEN